eukprot:GHVS01078219.1.p1 GENE.GHVS01078219.1~~GHVS01078219.1.p1  ORF type:complete len:303 (-),score=92.35 GHVS01078219.1:274-1137(-)
MSSNKQTTAGLLGARGEGGGGEGGGGEGGGGEGGGGEGGGGKAVYQLGRVSVEAAVQAVARGEMVAVVDDVQRENEGDLVMAAQFATPAKIARMIERTSGILCAAMDGDSLDRLHLPQMVTDNQDPRQTPFTVSVDAADGSTGVSPSSRCSTFLRLSNPSSLPLAFHRPGHVFPLRCHQHGLFGREGHTEAAVELCALAGLHTCAVIGEIKSRVDVTQMATVSELMSLAEDEHMVLTSIQDLICYKQEMEQQTDPKTSACDFSSCWNCTLSTPPSVNNESGHIRGRV